MVQVVCHWPQTTDLPGFSPRLLFMGFVVNKVALEQVLLPALLFSHVVVIPPLFQTSPITRHWHFIHLILATESVIQSYTKEIKGGIITEVAASHTYLQAGIVRGYCMSHSALLSVGTQLHLINVSYMIEAKILIRLSVYCRYLPMLYSYFVSLKACH
jgi:hypothetical protein